MLGKDQTYSRLLGALCLINAVSGMDNQLLPASFRAMEVELNFDPTNLALLSLSQGVSCSVFSIFWATLVGCGFPRRTLLTLGVTGWGCCTLMLAFVSSLWTMVLLRIAHGACIAMLVPIVQSVVAEASSKDNRGFCFGMVALSQDMGQLVASVAVTGSAEKRILGLSGWRVALAAVGFLSWVCAAVVPAWIPEEQVQLRWKRLSVARQLSKVWGYMQVGSFSVLIMQGFFATIPKNALSFSAMYFQYAGLSDLDSAVCVSLQIIGTMLGSLLGGMIGDRLARWSPDYGRTLTAQLTALLSIPFVWAIFVALPRNPDSGPYYALLFALQGLVGTWAATGCVRPVICEVMPRRGLGLAYAWEAGLVYLSGNVAGPTLVARFSEGTFGYRHSNEVVSTMPQRKRAINARALGLSIFVTTAVPWIMIIPLFWLLYYTYPHDRKDAEAEDSDDDPFCLRDASPFGGDSDLSPFHAKGS